MDKKNLARSILMKLNPSALAAQEMIALNDFLVNKVQLAKGDKGDKPVKGEDYFTENEIEEFLKQVTPVKGVHYFTEDEVRELIKVIVAKVTPVKGVHYFTKEEIRDFIKQATPIKGIHYFDGQPGEPVKMPNVDLSPLLNKIDELKKSLPKTDEIVKEAVKAVKNLKGDERLSARNIKDLPLSKPEKKIDFSDMRWHGGGLTASGIYTETPAGAINSSNKVYTVTHTINNVIGFAINGEFIHPAEYSFSGNTITFVTALDSALSGTSFSITYV